MEKLDKMNPVNYRTTFGKSREHHETTERQLELKKIWQYVDRLNKFETSVRRKYNQVNIDIQILLQEITKERRETMHSILLAFK
jgi:hypothetical protein